MLTPFQTLAGDREMFPLSGEIHRAILNIRSTSSPSEKSWQAESLAMYVWNNRGADIDDAAIFDLIDLLDAGDRSVRSWAAAALGFLGPRAQVALPALRRALASIPKHPDLGGFRPSSDADDAIAVAIRRIEGSDS